ncbi:MAG: hypothetical protein ACR2RB_19870 [Gammaproteobacteria bacterium]
MTGQNLDKLTDLDGLTREELGQLALNIIASAYGGPPLQLTAELDPNTAASKLYKWFAGRFDLAGMDYTAPEDIPTAILRNDRELPDNVTFTKQRTPNGTMFNMQCVLDNDEVDGLFSFIFQPKEDVPNSP